MPVWPVMEPKPPDAYEVRYMPTDGALIHRERMVQQYHWVFLVMAAVPLVVGLGMLVASALSAMPAAIAAAPLGLAALFAALWATFSVLRVHVSSREVLVQLGPLGPRLALANIESSRVIGREPGRYSAGKYRILPDGTREHWFMMSTEVSELVEIVAREEKGTRHRVVLSSHDPSRLVRTIEEARAKLAGGVRVDASDASAPNSGEERGVVIEEARNSTRR